MKKQERNRLTLKRLAIWHNSSKVMNAYIDTMGNKKYRVYQYDCSAQGCGRHIGLRETPSGIWCKHHYVYGEPCSEPGCDEPAVPDDGNREHKCREHWLGELPDVDLMTVAYALYQTSPIAQFEEEDRIYFDRTGADPIGYVEFKNLLNKWAKRNMPDDSRRAQIEDERAYYSKLKERRLDAEDAIDPL